MSRLDLSDQREAQPLQRSQSVTRGRDASWSARTKDSLLLRKNSFPQTRVAYEGNLIIKMNEKPIKMKKKKRKHGG